MMVLLSGSLAFILVLSASFTNCEKVYTLINMTKAKPYDEIPCPDSCGSIRVGALKLSQQYSGSVFKEVPFTAGFCERCTAGNMLDYTVEHKCFTNSEKNIFDHYFQLKLPKFDIRCDCRLSANASITAARINEVNAVKGQCGIAKYENEESCQPIQCNGNQGTQGQGPVVLSAEFLDAQYLFILRIDTRENQSTKDGEVYPIMMTITTGSAVPIHYEGPPSFDEAGKCLDANQDGLMCRLFANVPTPFFACLNPNSNNIVSFFGSLYYAFGKC